MSSAKTLNLLATAHTYKAQGKKVVVLKPALDVRFGKTSVTSRAGLDREADFLIEPRTELPPGLFDGNVYLLLFGLYILDLFAD